MGKNKEFEIICEQPNGIVTADMKVVYPKNRATTLWEIIWVAPGKVWGQADFGIPHGVFGPES
ncbi:MAG: hypothetical protein CM15mP49_06110 [Actinomycetota bacterium]|nr:MAG: hypothetical protein CM15mP49_06110 [Actinomycetota bacterium]